MPLLLQVFVERFLALTTREIHLDFAPPEASAAHLDYRRLGAQHLIKDIFYFNQLTAEPVRFEFF